jgi:hypothetical protein
MPDFTDLIAASDLGVNLRRPPTNGETSGALLYLLASGVATIVTDVATFSDYPDHAVRKVRWESEGPAGLEHALRTLAADRAARGALGRSAQGYVRAHHEWSRVAEQYVDAIERCRAERRARRGGPDAPASTLPRPHFCAGAAVPSASTSTSTSAGGPG